MSIIPVNDRVLLEPLEVTLPSGLVLTGSMAKKRLHGRVLAVGSGKLVMEEGKITRCPISSCKVGDTVVYGNVATTVEEELDGKKLLLVQEAAIVAILEE